MRLIVISDSHGKRGNVFEIIEKHIENADCFLCLGDCNSGDDFDDAKIYFGNKLHLISVCGNTDFRSTEPIEREFKIDGKRVLMCHGHSYYVKQMLARLIAEAKNREIDIAFFGHTHQPHISLENGVYIVNPGSASSGCYAIVDINGDDIKCRNMKL